MGPHTGGSYELRKPSANCCSGLLPHLRQTTLHQLHSPGNGRDLLRELPGGKNGWNCTATDFLSAAHGSRLWNKNFPANRLGTASANRRNSCWILSFWCGRSLLRPVCQGVSAPDHLYPA